MTIDEIAEVAHAVNQAYRHAIHEDVGPAWLDSPAEQRQAIRAGVFHTLSHPDVTPMESHESWRQAYYALGWRYGPRKSEERKEHPNLVPYDELPYEQRTKDAIFLAVVRALAQHHATASA